MRIRKACALIAAIAAALAGPFAGSAAAQPSQSAARISDGTVKIGAILDLSGPYSDTSGRGSATAIKMAVSDFGGSVLGAPVQVLIADHHNSPDQALAIARDWFDHQHVDAIMDVTGSSPAQLVQRFGDVRHKIVMLSSAVAERLSNEACTPTSVHYVFTTRAIARTVGSALIKRGKDTWFFITVDYSFGYDLEHDTEDVVEDSGGQVVGGALHPLGATDFTSYLARARASRAKVIGVANGGDDLVNTIKTASQLGMLPGPQILAGLAMRINQVQALGLALTQGMVESDSFYWDMNDQTRAWAQRFYKQTGKMPDSVQAGVYSATLHYLKAVAHAGTDDTDAVMKAMRDTPVDDFFAHNGHIRADGVMVHDMYLFQVKSPADSHGPWDDLKLVATIPGDEAFGSLKDSKCPLVQR